MKKYTALSAEPYTPTSDESRADTEELTREQRQEVRDMLLGVDAQNAMKFEERIRRIIPHAPTAVVLRELLFWQDMGHARDGWVYKTQAEWSAKGLSRDNVDTARRNLAGVNVLEQRRWYGGRLYYRVRLLDLLDYLETVDPQQVHESEQDDGGETLNHGSRLRGSHKPDCGVPTNRIAGFPHSQYRENYRENNISLSAGAAFAAPHQNLNEVKEYTREHHDQDQDDTATDLVTSDAKTFVNGKPYNAPRVTEILEKLLTHFDLVPEGFKERERGRYKKWFADLIHDGVEPEQMFAVILHMLDRWQHHQLTPKVAYGDVRARGGISEDEFKQGLNDYAANATGARGSRLPSSEGSGKGPVPQRSEWVLRGHDRVDEVVGRRSVASSFLSWLLERAAACMWDETTESAKALAAWSPGEDMTPVLSALYREVPCNEDERAEWDANTEAVQSIVTQYKAEKPRMRHLADELAQIAERRERELAEERERTE